ncbi:TPA: hypothetical protein U1B46_000840 [Streptococcus suis]|nr:hypothetical protein [Streptococcus suis]
MKQELGSFDGSQIRINADLPNPESYDSKGKHELAHIYLTYLSTLGILQSIAKEYSGVHSDLYKYLFNRGNKIQEIVALFYEYSYCSEDIIRKRLVSKLNGITTEAKTYILELLDQMRNSSNFEPYRELIITIGIASLSGNFDGMTIAKFFNSKPQKNLETFFREKMISPKKHFEEIVKFCKELFGRGLSISQVTQEIYENKYRENIDFIIQDPLNVMHKYGSNLYFDVRRENFDLILNIIVSSNLKKREEIQKNGVYQIPILSKLDTKYKEINAKESKKILKEINKSGEYNFLLLKEFSMFKATKFIDVVVPKFNKGLFEPLLFNSNLDKLLSQQNINIVTRVPRSLNFEMFLSYFTAFVLNDTADFSDKRINFFILGSETQMEEIIDELVKEYGESSLKYFYNDHVQNLPLISVFEAERVNVIIYSSYALERDWNREKLSSKVPTEDINVLISLYMKLLFGTDLFDRI